MDPEPFLANVRTRFYGVNLVIDDGQRLKEFTPHCMKLGESEEL